MTEVVEGNRGRAFDILDINMGCPVPKVVNNGEGSALLKNPELIVKIVKSISSAIQKPLTVKFVSVLRMSRWILWRLQSAWRMPGQQLLQFMDGHGSSIIPG